MRLSRRHPELGTVGAFPGASLLYVEGRAHALAEGDDRNHELGDVDELRRAQARVCDGVGELLGALPKSKMALRRADLTGELAWDRGEDGQEFLKLLDGLHSPLHKTAPVREKGGPALETAYWRTPQRSAMVLRAYDKGVESGTAPAGTRIRLERQMRYSGKLRPTLEQWLERDLAALYTAPLRMWMCGGGVAAGTAAELLRVLTDAAVIWPNYWASGSSWVTSSGTVHCSLWPARKVERVLGTLAVVDAYGRNWPAWSPKQKQRRLMEVRQLGLLLTDQPIRVDVDQAVGSLCDLWRAAA